MVVVVAAAVFAFVGRNRFRLTARSSAVSLCAGAVVAAAAPLTLLLSVFVFVPLCFPPPLFVT